jgi:hypothetical protein
MIAYGGTLSNSSLLSSYSYVIVGGAPTADATAAAALPGKSLAYMDGTTLDNVSYDNGMPYQQALSNGWLLKDAAGNYVHPYGNSNRYLGDVGNSAYQQAFITNVRNKLATTPGLDGIFLDNVVADVSPTWMTSCGCFPAKYPSLAAWQTAQVGFVAALGSALKSSGFYVLPNAQGWTKGSSNTDNGVDTQNWWIKLAPYVSGLMNEYWMQNANNVTQLMSDGSGGFMTSWAGWQKLVSIAQSHGVDFFGSTQGSSTFTQGMRFGKASFLLDWDGGGGAFTYSVSPAFVGPDPYNAAWASDLGAPQGAKFAVLPSANVWRRNYTRGVVVVNPTTGAVVVAINGINYTIGPTDALMLQT